MMNSDAAKNLMNEIAEEYIEDAAFVIEYISKLIPDSHRT